MQRHLGPSELGNICDRLVVGKMAGIENTNHVSSPWPSFIGTAVHIQLAEAFRKENAINGVIRWLPEVKVAPDPAYPGTADLYDWHTKSLVDHKVIADTTMRKVMSANGPPWHYVVQLLLYAQGYRRLGFPVDRVVLAAWPRVKATMDELYCWERPYVPSRDDEIIQQVLAVTAARRQVADMVLSGRIPIEQVRRIPSDECFFCLSGDTEVVTRDGIKPIRELAGTSPELLVPDTGPKGGLKSRGTFQTAEVREFGSQRLHKITLASRRGEKIIYATAEHRWVLASGRGWELKPAVAYERVTSELQSGDRLRPLRAAPLTRVNAMPVAVAQGFVFGDGSRGQGDRPATVTFCTPDKQALTTYFPLAEPAQYGDILHLYGLPRFWKDTPPIRESRPFLLSWLAGYFAADGTVAKSGQTTLHSADEQAIRFVRDVAAVCGIGTSPVRSKWRTGFGQEPSELWSIDLRRRDLPDWFFLIREHAIRAASADESPARGTYWTVKSVQVTDRFEQVYCAIVPGTEAFGLAEGIMTRNCPFYRPQSALDGGPWCPGHSAPV
jgi:hypothetical protein